MGRRLLSCVFDAPQPQRPNSEVTPSVQAQAVQLQRSSPHCVESELSQRVLASSEGLGFGQPEFLRGSGSVRVEKGVNMQASNDTATLVKEPDSKTSNWLTNLSMATTRGTLPTRAVS